MKMNTYDLIKELEQLSKICSDIAIMQKLNEKQIIQRGRKHGLSAEDAKAHHLAAIVAKKEEKENFKKALHGKLNEKLEIDSTEDLNQIFEEIEILYHLREASKEPSPQKILPLVKIGAKLEGQANIENISEKLSLLFKDSLQVMNFLNRCVLAKKDDRFFLRKSSAFPLPKEGSWDVAMWQQILSNKRINTYPMIYTHYLANADKIEQARAKKIEETKKAIFQKTQAVKTAQNQNDTNEVKKLKGNITELKRQLSNYQKPDLDTLRLLDALSAYERAEENIEAAILFRETMFKGQSKHENTFNQYLDLELSHNTQIPDVRLEGAELKAIDSSLDDYYIMKLTYGDPRAPILGDLTGCCQSLDGEGSECVIHGLTQDDGGFYVLCKKNKSKTQKDTVVAQTWAWRSAEGHLVFDSIEEKEANSNNSKLDAKTIKMFSHFAKKLVELDHTTKVNVGIGANVNSKYEGRTEIGYTTIQELKPTDYDGYRDSTSRYDSGVIAQRTLYDNNFVELSKRSLIQGDSSLADLSEQMLNQYAQNPETLLWAIDHNDPTLIKKLIELGARRDVSLDFNSPMRYVINKGSVEVFKVMIEGIDLYTLTENPLITAVEGNRPDIINCLLHEYQFNVNFKGSSKLTPIECATELYRHDLVQLLIENQARLDNPETGENVLWWLQSYRDKAFINQMIENGADLHSINKDGKTLLGRVIDRSSCISKITSARFAYKDDVVFFIEKGCRISRANELIELKRMGLVENYLTYHPELPEEIIREILSDNSLGSLSNEVKAVKKIILNTQKNIDKDLLNQILIHSSDDGLIELAVKVGADINAVVDNQGTTVLMAAVDKNANYKIKKLLSLGADVSITDQSGNTALSRMVPEAGEEENPFVDFLSDFDRDFDFADDLPASSQSPFCSMENRDPNKPLLFGFNSQDGKDAKKISVADMKKYKPSQLKGFDLKTASALIKHGALASEIQLQLVMEKVKQAECPAVKEAMTDLALENGIKLEIKKSDSFKWKA